MVVNQHIYERLKEVAREKSITYYGEIAPLAGLDMATEIGRIRIAQILDEINQEERNQARPMLSAVVILRDGNMPGTGFFECARGLGQYHGSNNDKDKLMFWVLELGKVHSCWQTH